MTHVILFGDSISYGLFDDSGGWVQRIRAQVDKRNDIDKDYWTIIYNLGVLGDTAGELLKRIELDLPPRIESDSSSENIILFALGTNDAAYLINENRQRYSDKEFQNNLGNLLKVARNHAKKIGFIGLFFVDQAAVDPIPWAPEMAYRNVLIKNFDSIIRNFCAQNKLDFIELLSLWNEGDAKRFLRDGVHPNPEGHRVIAEKVAQFFKSNNLI